MSKLAIGRRPLQEGFSLIEMLVVVAILGILASVGLPLAELAHKRQHEQELRASLREIRSAIDTYKKAGDLGHIVHNANESGYPPTLDVLVDGVEDARSPTRDHLYFLRKIPDDPVVVADDPEAKPVWALRSYESPSTDPKPGDDVFDVHSTSDEIGLNGVPYKLW